MSTPYGATAQGLIMATVVDTGSSFEPLLRKPQFLSGAGQLAGSLFVYPWHGTGVGRWKSGQIERRTLVGVTLCAGPPMFHAWDAARALIFNDSYAALIGNKHPAALRAPMAEVFSEVGKPTADGAMTSSAAGRYRWTHVMRMRDYDGQPAEAHFTFLTPGTR